MTHAQIVERDNSVYTHSDGSISVEHKGTWYEYDSFTNRYYRMDEPSGFYSKLEREGGMAKRRISKKAFEEVRQIVEEKLKSIGKEPRKHSA